MAKDEYSKEQVTGMAQRLLALPPKPKAPRKLSKQEFVQSLAKEISVLQTRGYTIEEIVAIFQGDGVSLSPGTLRTYLQRANGTKRKPKKAKIGKPILETIPGPPEPKPEPARAPLTLAQMKEIPRQSAFEVKPDVEL